jgi:GTPase SAR1 family protein
MEGKKKQSCPLYKVLLIGDGGVGKTSIIMASIGMEFMTETVPTMGIEQIGFRGGVQAKEDGC